MNATPHMLSDEQVKDWHRRLLNAVRRNCPAWLASQAEDIAQEALIKIVGAIQRTGETDRSLPASYINKTAYHAIVDAMRRNRHRGGMVEVAIEEAAETAMDEKPHADPERASQAAALNRGIRQCLEGIVESRRVAAVLHLQGHSVPEIAALMDWSRAQSTNLVYRGLKDLRRCLEKKGISP